MPRTRIVCTLGPATDGEGKVQALIHSGMNVARINFSHGTPQDHLRRIESVRRAAVAEGAVVALMGDLQGPKIRIGEIAGTRELSKGETVRFALGPNPAPGDLPLPFPFLGAAVKPGDHFLIDDGNIEVEVLSSNAEQIEARVITGGPLSSHKGVNFPSIDLPVPSLTDKDQEDARWAIRQGFDYLALSFVRRPQDVRQLQELLAEQQADIPVIAKIEKPEALREIDAILEAADGVMVARGDLGVELPAEQVPIYQKEIIHKANQLGKPVITATQMLESMIHNPHPTRAEASDVANAILDGSDAVMLSGETAVGSYPIEAVRAMAHIADYTEKNLANRIGHLAPIAGQAITVTDAIGQNTVDIAEEVGARLIITLTESGRTARVIARHRPHTPMLAVTVSERIRRRLALVWGADSCLIRREDQMENMIEGALEAGRSYGVSPGERVVLTAGVPPGVSGRTNMIQVRQIPSPGEHGPA